MTPIERFKELIELAEMVRDNSNTAWDLSTIGPKLLALVDAVEECNVIAADQGYHIYPKDWERIEDALAKLKEDE